jgi:hypothetical protein
LNNLLAYQNIFSPTYLIEKIQHSKKKSRKKGDLQIKKERSGAGSKKGISPEPKEEMDSLQFTSNLQVINFLNLQEIS